MFALAVVFEVYSEPEIVPQTSSGTAEKWPSNKTLICVVTLPEMTNPKGAQAQHNLYMCTAA
jgi:hypothetical protein